MEEEGPENTGEGGDELPDGGTNETPATQSVNGRYCHSCGENISEAAAICPECGVRQETDDATAQSRTGQSRTDRSSTSRSVSDGASTSGSGTDDDGGGEPSGRYMSAFVGSVVSFFIGWIPIVGPTIGGAIAGYLRGSDNKESAISGLLANVLAAIPMMGLVAIFLLLGGLGAVLEGDADVAVGIFLWAAIFAGGFLYFFALGAVGGVVGALLSSRRAP